ncbi:unnamed protein product [Lymnaea stagnalis]|uniref:LITAF domain-containing protein n=1 Tax=Lymnaea stagnalis TaxID=6523 RepID=A0AAV2IQ29_LYMST
METASVEKNDDAPPKYEPPQPGSLYAGAYPPYPNPQLQGQPGDYSPKGQTDVYLRQGQPGTYPIQCQPGVYPLQSQAGFYPCQGQPAAYPPGFSQTTVIVQPQVIVRGEDYRFMQNPARIVCQHCQEAVTTKLTYEAGLLTYSLCGLIICFGLCCGCCLIPFFMDGTKDVEHRCCHCDKVVGKFRPCTI